MRKGKKRNISDKERKRRQTQRNQHNQGDILLDGDGGFLRAIPSRVNGTKGYRLEKLGEK